MGVLSPASSYLNSLCSQQHIYPKYNNMSVGNPAPNVGGTAQDGGLSTADTVRDGGPDDKRVDAQYLPPGGESQEKPFTRSQGNVKTSNPAPGVGGTAKDGGLSTAATVSDGGPEDRAEDP